MMREKQNRYRPEKLLRLESEIRDCMKYCRIFRELCTQAEAPFSAVKIRPVLKFFRNSDVLLFILTLLILISGTIKILKTYQI